MFLKTKTWRSGGRLTAENHGLSAGASDVLVSGSASPAPALTSPAALPKWPAGQAEQGGRGTKHPAINGLGVGRPVTGRDNTHCTHLTGDLHWEFLLVPLSGRYQKSMI